MIKISQFFIEDLYLWFSRAYATEIRRYRDVDTECGAQCVTRRAFAAHIGAGQIALERCAADLGMMRVVILALDPRVGGLIEQWVAARRTDRSEGRISGASRLL
jgi:hypothetical protein